MGEVTRWQPDEGVVANDREESRSAARFDQTTYVRINGHLYDANEVPDLADVVDLDERIPR